jgi:hypothetical protein
MFSSDQRTTKAPVRPKRMSAPFPHSATPGDLATNPTRQCCGNQPNRVVHANLVMLYSFARRDPSNSSLEPYSKGALCCLLNIAHFEALDMLFVLVNVSGTGGWCSVELRFGIKFVSSYGYGNETHQDRPARATG